MAGRISLFAIAVALALTLCACGGAGATATAGTSSTTPSDSSTTAVANDGRRQLPAAQQQAFQAYRDCLKDNGVDLPAGGFGDGPPPGGPPDTGAARTPRSLPAGVDQATFDKAQAACGSKLPAGGFGGQGPGQGLGGAAFQAYLSCLRDNGVAVPAVQPGVSTPPSSIDRNDPAFAAADAKCRVLLPSASSSTTSTSEG